MNNPKYPIYIPSKNRADVCYTAKFFIEDNVNFKIVAEPSQLNEYLKYYDNNDSQIVILEYSIDSVTKNLSKIIKMCK